MSYHVTLNSRNVLVPIALDDRNGERMLGPLARLETATAMVIQISATGAFTQEFFPLILRQQPMNAYSGDDWELWSQKLGNGLHAYYIGVPNRCFAVADESLAPKTISVQVIGNSPLSGQQSFSGGVDISLQSRVATPLIPGYLNSCERFLPTLLPHNFIDHAVLDHFSFGGKDSVILMVSLQSDPADRIPVSLEKHWEPKGWIDAVIENLATGEEKSGNGRYATIRGGCFYGRNRKVSHWFGSGFGLEEKGFRESAVEKIRGLGPSGKGAWIFWLRPQGKTLGGAPGNWAVPGRIARSISIRHPMTHRLLGSIGTAPNAMPMDIGWAKGESSEAFHPREALAALQSLAGILIDHQQSLQSLHVEPAHADWSQHDNIARDITREVSRVEGNISVTDAKGMGGSDRGADTFRLETDIRALYALHGETLRILESIFDETYGFSAWDAVGNPLREAIAGMLVEPS